MPAAAAERRGAKDRAYEYVKAQVMTGAFPGGELISEGEVASALGMSRTPVRESFLRLEAEGLLRLYPQRGALVVPVSPGEVRAVMEARLVCEQFAVEKVIRLNETERAPVVAELTDLLDQQRATSEAGKIEETFQSDRLFHTTLLDAAANEFLGGLYVSLRDRQVRMTRESALRDPRRLTAILGEHARITDAVRHGDLAGAREAVRVHLLGTVTSLGLAVDPESPLAAGPDGGQPVRQ
jgi:DNA-binding GntR family transcriptional regulator